MFVNSDSSTIINRRSVRRGSQHRALTLIEVLIAVAIFSVLMTIIFVPIRLAFDTLNLGRAKASLQQASQVTMTQLESDLRQAIFVFPNSQMAGITDSSPYSTNNNQPYKINKAQTDAPNFGICTTGTTIEAFSNPARIDLLMPRRYTSGTMSNSLVTPLEPADYVVTYYARRVDITRPYSLTDNPIVLYRAQMPYRTRTTANVTNEVPAATGTPFAGNINVEPGSARLVCGTDTAKSNAGSLWLMHNAYGELDLAPLATDYEDTSNTYAYIPGLHSLAIPSNLSLYAPHAEDTSAPSFVPATTFTPTDTDNDGKIDRVAITLALQQVSASNAATVGGNIVPRRFTINRVVDLPNVR